MHSLYLGLAKLFVHKRIDYINFCSFLLILIIFGNLNGMFNYMFDIVAPLSPIILVLSVIIIARLVYKNYEKESLLFWSFTAFYLIYLYISSISYLLYNDLIFSGNNFLITVRGYLSSIIILLSFYKLTTWALANQDFYSLLSRMYIFLLLGVAVIFFSSVIGFNIGLDMDRASGFFANPNTAAGFILYCLCLTLCFAISEKKIFGFMYLLLVPALFYTMFITFSKAGLITFPIVVFAFLGMCLLRYRKLLKSKRKIFIWLFLSLILAIGVMSYYFSAIVDQLSWGQFLRLQRTLAFLSGEFTEATTSERSTLFNIGFQLIGEHPILGNGLTSFHAYDIPVNGKHIGVHNTFLLILGESGILPFIMYSVLILILIIKSWRLKNLAISFLFVSIMLVYVINIAGTGHNGLDDRVSNCLFGVMIGYFAYVDRDKIDNTKD